MKSSRVRHANGCSAKFILVPLSSFPILILLADEHNIHVLFGADLNQVMSQPASVHVPLPFLLVLFEGFAEAFTSARSCHVDSGVRLLLPYRTVEALLLTSTGRRLVSLRSAPEIESTPIRTSAPRTMMAETQVPETPGYDRPPTDSAVDIANLDSCYLH